MPSRRPFWLLFTLALLNGLVFVFLVPPWQHYDEPNHFEYVWLAAHRPGWPQEGDFDRSMRAATLQSMIDRGFFRDMGEIPPLDVEEPWIGSVSQVGDAPLYYALASLPLRFFPPLAVLPQLYAARLVSWLLFLATLALAWGTAGLLFPQEHPLRWMTPAFLAALPSFVDIMTAVNNDVAAIAVAFLFLYFATRLLRRGWESPAVLGAFLAAALALFAKRSVFFLPLLLPPVLLFALLRGAQRRWAWALTLLVAALGLAASLRGGDAALWYRRTPQQETTRLALAAAPVGDYALRLRAEGQDPRYQLLQLLPSDALPPLAGRTLTLGAWLWASAPVDVAAPRLYVIGRGPLPPSAGEARLSLTAEPRFYAWTIPLPPEPFRRAWVQIGPLADTPSAPVEVYADGLILAAGEYPLAEAPQWDTASGISPLWGGQRVENLIRNPSGERAWIGLRPWVDEAWSRVFVYTSQRFASFIAYTLRDWPGAGWYYRSTAITMFRTFWARFGWGHVPLLGHKPYRGLALLSALLLLGGLGYALLHRALLPGNVLLVYGLLLLVSWGLAVTRGAHHVLSAWVNIPVARYAFPAAFPLAVWFSAGACAWESLLARLWPFLRRVPGLLWALFLVVLTIWGWVSIYAFYAA